MLETGNTIGRYRVVELIGSGGMGEVYLAEDTELQRRVAIKLFTRELPEGELARDHLLHEARAASALSHPNVCTIFEVAEDDGRPYIVMEYVEGRTLDSLIAGRELPTERVVRYGAQIADAIAHAHAAGVVHRDLKSANVVITNDGRAKVLDFGLASTNVTAADTGTREVTSAETGRISGTLSYMAPEILRGQAADARGDVWALGVILYEASVGRLPFGGETSFEVSTAIMKDSVDIPAETSPGLRAVIQHCLEKAPGERYQSAAEVRAALEALQSGTTTTGDAVPAEVAAAARAAATPRWLAVAVVFSLVAVVALAAWVVFGPSRDAGGADTGAASGVGIGASGRPTIAVLPFRDHTGSEEMAWLAEGVPSMLLTSLAQTEGLDVVSNSRVQQIAAQLGEETLLELDTAALAEFARRSGAGAVVAGDLYYTGTEYRFDVQVEDVASGRVLDAYSASGPFVFPLVDQLSERIRAGLELTEAAATQSIAEVTTDSLEAWRQYEEGVWAQTNLRYPAAIRAFEAAIGADPDFVMAHYKLSRLANWMPDPTAAAAYVDYVLANMDRVPERDRLLVEGLYALDRDGDYDRAEERLEELVRQYPDHVTGWAQLASIQGRGMLGFNNRQVETLQRGIEANPAAGLLHNQLGYALAEDGRYAEAVRAIERYVELNPEEPNAHDSLAEMYVLSGQPETAFDKYGDVLEVDPQWYGAYYGRTFTAAMLGRYDVALEELEKFQETWIGATGGAPSLYAPLAAMLLSKVGRYDDAMQYLRAAQQEFARAGVPVLEKSAELIAAHVALESGDLPTAAASAQQTLDGLERVEGLGFRSGIGNSARGFAAVAAAREGDVASAQRALQELRRDGAENIDAAQQARLLAGEIALAIGDWEAAEASFRSAEPVLKAFYSASLGTPTLLSNNHVYRDGVARAKVGAGDIEGAIRIYRDLITVDISSKYNAFLDPRYVLRLAELLDETGDTEEAREHYLRFAELWADADEQFQPQVERARARAAEIVR